MIFDSARPQLRPLELKWLDDGAEPLLFLRDPAGIAPNSATVPRWVALLLSLCDGQRDLGAICAAFELRTGEAISLELVRNVIGQLDEALFLESPRYFERRDAELRDYRRAAFRPPALADRVYPADPTGLLNDLHRYGRGKVRSIESTTIRGIVSPHIDYQRGGKIYAETWQRSADAVNEAELVVIFGTDHSGGLGKVTLTRQSFGTPLGVLPTAVDVVDAVADAIGSDDAFDEEIHHRREHSIELAAVWLHSVRRGAPPAIVPILCGSFHHFTQADADPAEDARFHKTIETLREATNGKRTLVVAAADLAHVGPAFGDEMPLDDAARVDLSTKDRRLLDSIEDGDAREFFGQLRGEQDSRRVCGLPPIYLMLRLLGTSRGHTIGYDQCPADPDGGSLVSIAGVVLE